MNPRRVHHCKALAPGVKEEPEEPGVTCFAAFEVGPYREIRLKTRAEEPFNTAACRELKQRYMHVRPRDTGEAADLYSPDAPIDNYPVLAPVTRQALCGRDNLVGCF